MSTPAPPTAADVVTALGLIPHPEGGFFLETYRAGAPPMTSRGHTDPTGATLTTTRTGKSDPSRNIMTSIYWMLTPTAPRGCWIRNESDHVHYHHGGDPITYHVVDNMASPPRYYTVRLGPPGMPGTTPQVMVKGGDYKASRLEKGGCGWALIGGAVAPGFDVADLVLLEAEQMRHECPEAVEVRGR